MNVTHLILKNLIHNEEYARSTLPYLKPKYFDDHVEQIVYEQIDEFITKYNSLPTREALVIELDNRKGMSEKDFSGCGAYIGTLIDDEKEDKDWLVNTTEKFCQEKALYNAIMDSIAIIDGNEEGQDKGAIPEILSEALSVSFDPNVGHDLIDDADARYDFYHRTEERVPFDIEYLNKITKGGLPKKSLTVLMAGTGVGKSLAMCHFASANVLDGKNVLYITMEMAEERIAERIDANLLNIKLDGLADIPKMIYQKKIAKVKGKTSGKMVVKEYPTSSAGVGHFRHLLNELKLKKGFVPDIIYIDYLNICMSSRMKMGASVNSYTYVKAIAEEIRGLAVESNVPIVTATQVNRTGYGDSDFGLEDTSESFGLPATTDLMLALISTEEMEAIDQIL
ncbi:AAA family ATPase, partial [candidate division WWE3 bacterium]|nr:AAA family ATPase [candidate division WWE3 bacterium]